MKKLKLLWLSLFVSLFANSQTGQINQINIVSFTVKNTLPGTIDNWMSTPGALVLIAQKVPNPRMVEPRLVIQIRSGGAVICGNNAATAKQVDPFDVRTFNTADLTGFLTGCHELKEGSYTICAQFFNVDKIAISREVCKEFRVEAAVVDYSPPTLITPENDKKFTQQELTGLVMFRWTPLVPKPKEPVTYRLRVWQLMQGQNGIQAMKSNTPVVTKDVENLTQAAVTGVITGPCRPPYMCDFIWNVQAIGRDGKPLGRNNGLSEAYTFNAIETTKCPNNLFPEDKKQFSLNEAKGAITFKWTAPTPGTPSTYRLRVWQLMQGQTPQAAMKSNQPIVTKEVTNNSEVIVNGIITGPCRPPYMCDFIWGVEKIAADGHTTCTTEPTTFSVANETTTCPSNAFPEDKKQFSLNEAKGAITFKWTAPTPGTSPTYRLRVWQLMQGQTPQVAMKSNQPIVTKEVTNNSEVIVNGIITGPCRPPYMCDFVWDVEKIAADGHTTCTTEPTTFSVANETTACPNNLSPEDKKQFTITEAKGAVTFKWSPVGPNPGETNTYRLRVWQLMQGQNGQQAMKSNQPIVTKEVTNNSEVIVNGIITGPCRPPYMCDFIWAVEMIGRDGHATCTTEPTTFNVKTETTTCPNNLFPEDKKKIKLNEAKEAITFKWTDPTPGEPSAYRLRVWQLMQGQNGTQAMKSNKPVVIKEVTNGTETIVTGVITGPCRPPYMCDFIWDVEKIASDGHSECTSGPSTFSIANNDIDIQIDSVHVSCCGSNGMQNVYIKIKNNLSNTVKITNLNIDKVNGVANVITITGLSPALPVNIAGLGSQVFTGTIKCIDTARTIRFFVRAEDAVDNAITETEVETDTLNCPCDPCRTMGVTVTGDKLTTVSSSSNEVTLSGTLSGLDPSKVKKVTIELVYFNIIQTGDSNCAKCAENKEWGNFVPPASHSFGGFNNPVLNGGNFGREWTWISTMDKVCNDAGNGGGHDNGNPGGCANCGATPNANNNNRNNGLPDPNPNNKTIQPGTGPGTGIPKGNGFSLPIAVPPGPALSCCGDKIKICIRYTWWDFCCHACDVIKCYEIERKPK